MAFEYINRVRDPMYPKRNMQNERFLIEFDGILHSEAEEIFYGMDGCLIMEAHPFTKYYELKEKESDDIYEQIGYYRPKELIRYLNNYEEIDEDEINAIIDYAKFNYDYSVATTTNLLGSIRNLIDMDYVNGITFVFTSNREKDLIYLSEFFGNAILQKKAQILMCNEETIIEEMKKEIKSVCNSDNRYTTVITNEYLLIEDILKDYKEYNANTMFFLLRNHNLNMRQLVNSESVLYEELHTDKIMTLINGNPDDKNDNFDHPYKCKFARFAPVPYKTDSPAIMMFGDQTPDRLREV